MGSKLGYISFSKEIEDTSEWLEAFDLSELTVTDKFKEAGYIVFVGDWINEHRWEKATKQNKLKYNLCELPIEKALEMLKVLLAHT